jgi:hypothetical protein
VIQGGYAGENYKRGLWNLGFLRQFWADSKGGVDTWIISGGRGVKIGRRGKTGKKKTRKSGARLAEK